MSNIEKSKNKIKVAYWCPFLTNVATIKAVLNSVHGLVKYGSNSFRPIIINSIGEFNNCQYETISLNKTNFTKFLPKYGFLQSRFSYILIFLINFFSLKKFLRKEKPQFLIAHLITILPLVLNFFFKFETKFILRISGYPKLGIVRKFLWRLLLKKIYIVTTPTQLTYNLLVDNKIIDESKIIVLKDPVIKIRQISKSNFKTSQFNKKEEYYLAVGRLTKQKNFEFLVKSYASLETNKKLFIAGEGEEFDNLSKIIKEYNLVEKVKLIGFKENIYEYFFNSSGFILSSLYEDPGFVIIEAAALRKPILSSNCITGPIEFLKNGTNGYLFQNNSTSEFIKKFSLFENDSKNLKNEKIKRSFFNMREYTIFNHYKKISTILNKTY